MRYSPLASSAQIAYSDLLAGLYSSVIPVMLKGLNVAAEPVRFLDYLIEQSQPAAVPVGSGLLIRVPDPARRR